MTTDWYENRHQLHEGMVFVERGGDVIMLDRRVPGDGTQWYVADWWNGSWSFMDGTVEPSDLERRLPEQERGQ